MDVSGETRSFRQFVLKVHSRCDLACDHCYVYEHADQSWRARPTVIAPETVERAGERIAEHARDHGLPEVRVILHGGEPLLAGAHRLAEIAAALRRAISPVCHLDLRIHTNGVRLDTELCEVFLAGQVMVGISLDGDQAANDLHRLYRDGRSSYPRVIRAVELLRQDRYRHLYAGLLATIDLRSDPVAAYRALAALEPPNLDFLLPHGTWDAPPPHAGVGGETRYADWLAKVYAEWTRDGRRVPIRIFESLISTTLGGASSTESLGLAPSDVAVIETDGSIEQADSIKVAFDGAPATGLDVFTDPLDAAADHPGVKARQQGLAGLSATCRECPVVNSCGGGLYAHRYKTGSGFDNPSVYCADLKKIVTHVRAGLGLSPAARPAATRAAAGAEQRVPVQLPEPDFDALAAGFGDAGAVGQLNAAQRNLQRSLLRMLRGQPGCRADRMFGAGLKLIVGLDRSHRAVVDSVLAHPYVRAWSQQCLRAETLVRQQSVTVPGHLAAIAAAAAIKSGTLAEVEVPVTNGYVHLPTLGRLRVGDAGTAVLAATDGAFEVRAASGKWHIEPAVDKDEPDWQPTRQLRAGDFTVLLEDTDPFRDVHKWRAAARLTAAEVSAWQEQFVVAWSLIRDTFPAYAPGIATGLRVLMPLAGSGPGSEIASSTREAYGAVAAALPATGDYLASLLIHEFQHVKLGALFDLFDLYDRTDQRLFFAPWREDPRPVGALLQGTYAHLGVTDYWRGYRHRAVGQAAATAVDHFARWRLLTHQAIETLASSGALTSLGERLVARMRGTIEPWLDEPVPASAAASALRWAAERLEAWECRGAR